MNITRCITDYRSIINNVYQAMLNELSSMLQTRPGFNVTEDEIGDDAPALRNEFADYAEILTGIRLVDDGPQKTGIIVTTDEDPNGFPAEALGIQDLLKVYEACRDAVAIKPEENDDEKQVVLTIRTDLGGDITYKKITCRDRKHAADEVRKHQELLEKAGEGPFHCQPLCPGADIYVNDDETVSFEVTEQKIQ